MIASLSVDGPFRVRVLNTEHTCHVPLIEISLIFQPSQARDLPSPV